MRPQVGLVINNKYRLVRLIGDGGMGSVYEARHEVLATTVALKFLHPELARRGGLVQRFLQEARVSAAIHSPHVVRVSDVDQTSTGLAYIVMEYLEGRTLQTLYEDLYRAGQRMTYGDALEYAMQLLEGVEAAHKAGIVHRDLKPDNVMITTGLKGEPLIKILDFGIAKLRVTGELDKGLTRPGVIMGTPEYMAPEQAYSADAVDARADIFSLGVIVFEMLAGRRPVGGDDPHQIASAYLSGQVAKLTDLAPHVDPALAAAIHKAMAPLAKDRFATVGELRAAIEPFLPAHAGGTPLPTPARESNPASPAAQLAPPTNIEDADAPRAVPKTIPPEADAPPSPALADVDPMAARHPAATPLGGFEAGPAAPREPSNPALAGVAEAPLSPVEPPRRPGGTDIAGDPFHGAPIPVATPVGLEAPPQAEMRPYVGGTAMDAGSYAPSRAPRKKAGGIGSFVLIVLFAAGVASAVVGGLYVAQQYGHRDEQADTPPVATAPPPTTTLVSSSAPPPDQPASTTPATPPPPPTQAYKPPPSHPATPPPQSTPPQSTPPQSTPPQTTPPPQPTSTPTSQPPSSRPPFVLPSALPTINFPLPGLPPLIPPGGQPTAPPPPQPTTPPPPQPTSSGHTRPPIIIHFPKGGRRIAMPRRAR